MKYAFMSFSCPDLNLDEMLALAKQLGYDGIEPRAGSGHNHGIELESTAAARAEFKTKAADSDIPLVCLATGCRYADPATVQAEIDSTRRYLDLAAEIGAPRLRVFGGRIPEGVRREAAIEQVSQALISLADHAAERDVVICLETHDDWCDPAHVVAVMQSVNRPSVAVNWDIMHPVRAGNSTMDQAFAALQPWIRHVHIHDGTAQTDALGFRPIGEGVYDHKRAVALLMEDQYDGYLSGEWINWEPYADHLPRELAAMKRYETELT